MEESDYTNSTALLKSIRAGYDKAAKALESGDFDGAMFCLVNIESYEKQLGTIRSRLEEAYKKVVSLH